MGRGARPYLVDRGLGQVEADGAAQHRVEPLLQLHAARRPVGPARPGPRRPQALLGGRVGVASRVPVRPGPAEQRSRRRFFGGARFARAARYRRCGTGEGSGGGGGGDRAPAGLTILRPGHHHRRHRRFTPPPPPPPSCSPPPLPAPLLVPAPPSRPVRVSANHRQREAVPALKLPMREHAADGATPHPGPACSHKLRRQRRP